MAELILGPIFTDLFRVGLGGGHVRLMTAFYSGRALSSLNVEARELTFACRLDLSSIDDWGNGYVAPDRLLQFLTRLSSEGKIVHLYASPTAHAKLYVGTKGAMVGSANLTLTGFGGGDEVVSLFTDRKKVTAAHDLAESYARLLAPIPLDQLADYVRQNRAAAERRKGKRSGLDRLPRTKRSGRKHLGDYEDFLTWLKRRRSPGAAEIWARANGKSNLSGHIHRNFFGLRQFLITYPQIQSSMRRESPEHYKLSRDAVMEGRIAEFVAAHAADEDEFLVDTWRTYLPIECGGRAGRHGGTIGNLNFMLPLVASYLDQLQLKR